MNLRGTNLLWAATPGARTLDVLRGNVMVTSALTAEDAELYDMVTPGRFGIRRRDPLYAAEWRLDTSRSFGSYFDAVHFGLLKVFQEDWDQREELAVVRL